MGKINRLSYKKSGKREKIDRLYYEMSGEREKSIAYLIKSLENGKNR